MYKKLVLTSWFLLACAGTLYASTGESAGLIKSPLGCLLLQLLLIILSCTLCAAVFKRLGQPSVIGEIIAGIVLGPSVVGHFFPGFSDAVFPAESLKYLQIISQVGIVVYMFIVGMGLDVQVVKEKTNAAVLISSLSIVLPFVLGAGLSAKYHHELSATPSLLSFTLFMGIAMSITAFPVLARIIQDRGLTGTNIGAIALTSAAIDDMVAWCLLTLAVAVVQATTLMSVLLTLVYSALFTAFMFFAVRPVIAKMSALYEAGKIRIHTIMALIMGIILGAAFLTEIIGIHAFFGAFITGVIIPQHAQFRKILRERVGHVSAVILLPVFFACTGLRTKLGLLHDLSLAKMFFIILAVAIGGKFAGSMIGARLTSISWKDSIGIGALMNTRGLMELIVITIALELGVFSESTYVMLVLMALVTTFLAGPILNVLKPGKS